jgi:hypothetical protein
VPKVAASKKVPYTAPRTLSEWQNSRRRTNRPSVITPVMPAATPCRLGYKVEKFNPLIIFKNLKGK